VDIRDDLIVKVFRTKRDLLLKSNRSESGEMQVVIDLIASSTTCKNNKKSVKRTKNKTNAKKGWSSGTGYGGSGGDPVLDRSVHVARSKQVEADNKMEHFVGTITSLVKGVLKNNGPSKINALGGQLRKKGSNGYSVCDVFRGYWRNDSLMDVTERAVVYSRLLEFLQVCLEAPLFSTLQQLFFEAEESSLEPEEIVLSSDGDDAKRTLKDLGDKKQNIITCINKLNDQGRLFNSNGDSNEFVERLDQFLKKVSEKLSKVGYYASELGNIGPMTRTARKNLLRLTKTHDVNDENRATLYVESLKDLQFRSVSLLELTGNNFLSYAFASEAVSIASSSKGRLSRIMKEMSTMTSSLPLSWGSGIFLRADESRPDVMCMMIIGPHGTPYANGAFIFDILLPANYPNVPPKVLLKTTGHGMVRFNPNLYNCGKVCLSLLGTWQGPGWKVQTSTLLQVLVSIQSLIFVDQPYFNEPGYENILGTTKGDAQSRIYNNDIQLHTMRHAILALMKNPPYLFRDVLDIHFRLKTKEIRDQCDSWAKNCLVGNHQYVNVSQEISRMLGKSAVSSSSSSKFVTVDLT